MAGKWRIIHQESGIVDDMMAQVASMGMLEGPVTYTIENVETGETRDVVAWDTHDLGTKIADGELIDE
jgi:hypothetical protein